MQWIGKPDRQMETDILVIGGGLAGVCAAIQAARQGCSVILAERQMSLGGNSSPEVGVHPSDAHRFHPYAAATGIIGEIVEEAAWTGAKTITSWRHYSIAPQWDSVMAFRLKEAGVRLLRRHDALMPEMVGDRIKAVILLDAMTWQMVRVAVRTAVIDASGDGQVSAAAGAPWRMGRESQAEYGERSAPEQADSITMGSSLVALVRWTSKPVPFTPPPGTPPFHPGYGGDLDFRPSPGAHVVFFFPTETGGDLNTIEDEAAIYERLLGHLYSAWNYVKNIKNPQEAANWELLWISSRVAKRESRRFIGSSVVTQQDVESGRLLQDSIAYGGFAVDVHHPQPDHPEYVRINYISIPPLYGIPYRALYCREVINLLFASRLLSATHLAHGTIRLQKTLAGIGQAAGAAAALMVRHQLDTAAVGEIFGAELQQLLLREDSTLPGVRNEDPDDLARAAQVKAGSELTAEALNSRCRGWQWRSLADVRGLEFWSWQPMIDKVRLRLKNHSTEPLKLAYALYRHAPKRPYQLNNERSREMGYSSLNEAEWGNDWLKEHFCLLHEGSSRVAGGLDGWQDLLLGLQVPGKSPYSDDDRLLLIFAPDEKLSLLATDEPSPLHRLAVGEDSKAWQVMPGQIRHQLCLPPPWGEANQVIDGISRRWSTNPMHAWLPDLLTADQPWIELSWPQRQVIGRIQITWDSLSRAAHDMPFECGLTVAPQMVRAYTLELLSGNQVVWQQAVQNHYHRVSRHSLPPVRADRLRLTLREVWQDGCQPGVYEIRAYSS